MATNRLAANTNAVGVEPPRHEEHEVMFPPYWIQFLEDNSLVGVSVEIPVEADNSSVGAEFDFMTAEHSRGEAEEAYPGIGVAKDGYVPVGNCELGTGDPYFINSNDGPNGPLYRIYHDCVGDENYDPEAAIDVVLENYSGVLRFIIR